MRDLAPLALLGLACGIAQHEPLGCTQAVPHAGAPTDLVGIKDAGSEAVDVAMARLVALGPTVAPGMHEVTRARSGGEKVEVAHADGRDACVRVAFAASSRVIGKLVDGAGNVLASSGLPTTDGILGTHGPVCVRKGDAVSAVADGADGMPARILWIAWATP